MRRIVFKPVFLIITVIVCALLVLPGISLAQGLGTILGKIEYRSSCASCHGAEGKGDGPIAEHLMPKPVNLQLISKNNGGVFPADDVYKIVDGRQTVRAHGSSEMPVWGSKYSEVLSSTAGGGESNPNPFRY